MPSFDSILIVAFGGPEGPDDVMPFLENVLRGRNVPRERLLEVAGHYEHFGGVSPINEQMRALRSALQAELAAHGPALPVYWGNRNWRPFLADTLRQMAADGLRHALALFTSPFSSYSSCRQYWENIAAARAEVGPDAPTVAKLRAFYNHPGFIETMRERLLRAWAKVPPNRLATTRILFTAHSVPVAMADTCAYAAQLRVASALTAAVLPGVGWRLVYQSRSGPPAQPWLEPDVNDELRRLAAEGGVTDVLLAPIGFLSDHVEVLYDLDHEARQTARELGLNLLRAETAGAHPRFVRGLRELIAERLSDNPARPVLGDDPPAPDACPPDCCAYTPARPAR